MVTEEERVCRFQTLGLVGVAGADSGIVGDLGSGGGTEPLPRLRTRLITTLFARLNSDRMSVKS